MLKTSFRKSCFSYVRAAFIALLGVHGGLLSSWAHAQTASTANPSGAQSNTATHDTSVQTITLGADASFEFAGSSRKVLGSKELMALGNLIANAVANSSNIDRLHVLGYSGPMGVSQVNERLVRERAQTVYEDRKENGLQMTSIGRKLGDPML
jgi:hypothetical protein